MAPSKLRTAATGAKAPLKPAQETPSSLPNYLSGRILSQCRFTGIAASYCRA
jgi:hypothetical protein